MTPSDIVYIRGSLGMTQEQFAESVNANVGTVSRWERGASKPWRKMHLAALAARKRQVEMKKEGKK